MFAARARCSPQLEVSLLTTYYLLLTAYHFLLPTYYLIPTTRYLLYLLGTLLAQFEGFERRLALRIERNHFLEGLVAQQGLAAQQGWGC